MNTLFEKMFLCSFLLLTACVTAPSGPRRDTHIDDSRLISRDIMTEQLGGGGGSEVTTLRAPALPWQVWLSQRDLSGQPLDILPLLEGDELFERSQFRDALARYQQAKALAVEKNEKDAIVIREAGAQLALGNPDGTLRTLSNYFRKSGRSEESVIAPFSLLFSYAYGSRGDVDQALAWFSRTNRLHAGIGGYHEAAERGIRALLHVPETQALSELATRWQSDSLISLVIGRELRRRSQPSYQRPNQPPSFLRFWQAQAGMEGVRTHGSPVGDGVRTVLGVLLPLSGKHAALGQKVKNGIQLAYLGQEADRDFVIELRDSLAEPVRAMSVYREFVNTDEPAVVLGPLLSDPAAAVRDIALNSPVPVLVFSKRSSFQVGRNVFRLGPTLQSQIVSLLQNAVEVKGMRRFLVVTPNGAVGEFYRAVFLHEAEALGAEVVFEAEYAPGDDGELVELATEIELLHGDAIFFPGTLKEASRLAGNLSREKREALPFLGLGTWDNPQELKKSRSILEGALFVSPFNVASDREVIQRFREAYQRKYGSAPDFLAAQGFDAATLVISAFRQARAHGESFAEGLRMIEAYEGLTGHITVDQRGELQRAFDVIEIVHGKRQLVKAVAQNIEPSEEVSPSYVYQGDRLVGHPNSSFSVR